MKLAQSVRLGGIVLILLNLVMAFGSIWVFVRMAPAIETIIEQNERSLRACEEMLSNLALLDQSSREVDPLQSEFLEALQRAKNNITEIEEPIAIESISQNFALAFSGVLENKRKTVTAIQQLSQINRAAMVRADLKARQLGSAGAWGVVFMASAVFMIGLHFFKSLRQSLLNPLEEIQSVIQAVITGDTMRRCTGPDAPPDIRSIFSGLNEILDKNTSIALAHQRWEK